MDFHAVQNPVSGADEIDPVDDRLVAALLGDRDVAGVGAGDDREAVIAGAEMDNIPRDKCLSRSEDLLQRAPGAAAVPGLLMLPQKGST
jgi:hypothetical protein